jgi:hypothetical protein
MRIHRPWWVGLAMGVMLVSGGRATHALAQERPAASRSAAAEALPERVPETRIVDPKARPAPRRPIRPVPPFRLMNPQPLLIVDGKEVPSLPGDHRDLQRFESVEIIRGRQAVAIYGERAAGGVVLVRSKRP